MTPRRHPFGGLSPRSHEIVLGVPGSGKSTLVRRDPRLASARRVVFFDPTDSFASEGERVRPEDVEADPSLLAGQFVRLAVLAGRSEFVDTAEEFAAVVRACRAASAHGGLVLVADEVGDYSRRCEPILTRLHRNGHHDGVASILISQCAVDVPLTCRRTATRVTSLLQTASADLEALSREYGDDFAGRVRRWRPGDAPAVWELPTLHRPTTAAREHRT